MSYINRDFSAGLDEQNERRTKRTKRTLEAQGTKKREKRAIFLYFEKPKRFIFQKGKNGDNHLCFKLLDSEFVRKGEKFGQK